MCVCAVFSIVYVQKFSLLLRGRGVHVEALPRVFWSTKGVQLGNVLFQSHIGQSGTETEFRGRIQIGNAATGIHERSLVLSTESEATFVIIIIIIIVIAITLNKILASR